MTQHIKPNTLVYIPSETNTLHKVFLEDGNMTVEIGDNEFCIINTQGQKYYYETASWGIQPFAFLATSEMKERLEEIYNELEDIPIDPEVKDFKKVLCTVLSETQEGNFDKKHFNELIQMFEERGLKQD